MSFKNVFLFTVLICLALAIKSSDQNQQQQDTSYHQRIQGLVDDPIIGDNIFYLDGTDWQVTCLKNNSNETITFSATVPGDIITDLETNGLVSDPLFEDNFLSIAKYVNNNTFTYTKTFNLSTYSGQQYIVFDGVKMGANIYLNGNYLGQITDQFLRYEFELLNDYIVQNSTQSLVVEFEYSIETDGRFMACTGGWDWAFFTQTTSPNGAFTFSRGIWKSVYVLQYSLVAITNVVPLTYYLGEYPTQKLQDGQSGDFLLNVTVFFNAAQDVQGDLQISADWGIENNQAITVKPGNTSQSILLNVSGSDINLWWPNGIGKQNLYNIYVRFVPTTGEIVYYTSRRIGFRVFALVTGNDTDPSYVEAAQNEQGTIGAQGMLFRVNGAAVWVRGANQIPMEEMEGKINANAYAIMVQSAADAGFNIIRIWGGGIYAPQIFYDTCDELGIMIFHDIQYAQQGHSPSVTSIQDAEHRYNIRRLSHHPSIILYDGCNECIVLMNSDTAIYADFVMTVVGQEDNSRSIMPSCPSIGWTTGVDKLYVRKNGSPLTTPNDGFEFELHGPYLHGTGFPAVNGNATINTFDPIIPLIVDTTQADKMGIDKQNIFHSEFGSSVFSSFESMAPTLESNHWGIHAGMPGDNCTGEWDFVCNGPNPMSQRNYPCDNIILQYFGKQIEGFDTVGKYVFQKQLFLCILGQALYIKGRIEQYRNQNQYGTIVWQYNEIWPTGGWGSIEYGTQYKGQVVGGRWKPLHYMYKRQLYTDVIATCGYQGQCYFRSDSVLPFKGEVVVTQINLISASHKVMLTQSLDVEIGPGKLQLFQISNFSNFNILTNVLQVQVFDENSNLVCDNLNLLSIPANLALQSANVTFTIAQEAGYDNSVNIYLNTDKVALFVTLTTLAQGRFSDNSFLLTPQDDQKIIQFIPFGPLDMKTLQSSLRVEHLNMYLANQSKTKIKQK